MDVKNLPMAVIGMVLAAVMISSALLPCVASALIISGDVVTYTNTTYPSSPERFEELKNTEITVSIDDGEQIIVNGVSVTRGTIDKPILFSDSVAIRVSESETTRILEIRYLDTGLSFDVTTNVNISFNNGEYAITVQGSEPVMGTYSWLYSVVEDGTYNAYIFHRGTTEFYGSNFKRDFITSGSYTTGELDTAYSYRNGVLTIANENYTGSIDYISALVEGTTNVYKYSEPVITVTDGSAEESFTPYWYIIKETVKGNSDSGEARAILSVLPIVVVAGLVMAGVYVFINRK